MSHVHRDERWAGVQRRHSNAGRELGVAVGWARSSKVCPFVCTVRLEGLAWLLRAYRSQRGFWFEEREREKPALKQVRHRGVEAARFFRREALCDTASALVESPSQKKQKRL